MKYRRTTALLAAVVALVVGAVVVGAWWVQRDDNSMSVDAGEYVPPSEIASSSTSSSSSSSTSDSPTSSSSTSPESESATSSSSASSTSDGRVVSGNPAGSPTRVQVSSSGRMIIDASLQPTMLDADKVLAPPFGTAGWYAEPGWPKPGFAGASILVGHINHGSNPDVFWNLPQVNLGDIITVSYSSGEQVKFLITRSEAASKKGVPQDDSIWDYDNPNPVLRLITCDPQTTLNAGHYSGNWVVWADRMVT